MPQPSTPPVGAQRIFPPTLPSPPSEGEEATPGVASGASLGLNTADLMADRPLLAPAAGMASPFLISPLSAPSPPPPPSELSEPSDTAPWRVVVAPALSGGRGGFHHAASLPHWVAQPFGVPHMLSGQVVIVWHPPLQAGDDASEDALQRVALAQHGVPQQLLLTGPTPPAEPPPAHARQLRRSQAMRSGGLPLVRFGFGPDPYADGSSEPWGAGGAGLDPLATAAAASLQLFALEQQRQICLRAAGQVRTLAALRALVGEIRSRPPVADAAPGCSPLQADDMDGFDARATYRLPAMLLARRLGELWHSGATGLELLDEAGDLSLAVAAALQRALAAATTPPTSASLAQLAAATETCIDGGQLGGSDPASALAVALLLVAHQMPMDLLSELLKQAVLEPEPLV